ncbi:putative glutaminyl-tRNA synthetase [Candidatus Zinderia insecticola CARI]|uniref:glutamine--tRNA ligase n=1 Tax=Zinderia insecticola (strain CARI) TaxID=871271 RepID=E0TIY5_ZINIC|nr:putative glutaminyl-tRNA synthetase [Candidatus Zinderia insecticola CARI]
MKLKKSFLDKIILKDIKNKKYNYRKDENYKILPNIITRFSPEPNGDLHIGHIKTFLINLNISKKYNGIFYLRFDDTNPNKEKKKYVISIIKSLKWLGYTFKNKFIKFASNYYDKFFYCAQILIIYNYVFIKKEKNNKKNINNKKKCLYLLEKMREGKYKEKLFSVRLNLKKKNNLIIKKNPIIYRIINKKHFNINNIWNIYPTYIFAHPLEDSIEYITHSFCTLEFINYNFYYNWILKKLKKIGIFKFNLSKQYEFSKLNITYILNSKRKIKYLINKKYLNNWKDERIFTISSLKKRGYNKNILKKIFLCNNFTKNYSNFNLSFFENITRKKIDKISNRIMCISNPIIIIINNFPNNKFIECKARLYSKNNFYYNKIYRYFPFTKKIIIEKNNLIKNKYLKLKYLFFIKCINKKKFKYYLFKEKNKKNIKINWISKNNIIFSKILLYKPILKFPFPNMIKNIKNIININTKIIKFFFIECNLFYLNKIYQFENYGYFFLKKININYFNLYFNLTIFLKNKYKK